MADEENGTTEQPANDAPAADEGAATQGTDGNAAGEKPGDEGEGSGEGEAQATARKPVDDRVSWRKHREVREEARNARRLADERGRELEQYRGRASTLEEQIRRSSQELEDHRSVVQALRDNPDLYESLKQRLNGGEEQPERTPAARAKGPVTVASLDQETMALVKEAAQYAKSQKEREAAAAKQRELVETRTILKESVTDLLKKAGYQERTFGKLVPHVMRDIVALAHELPGEGSLEDIPFLFNEWLGVQAELDQERTATRIAAKTNDARIPPSMPGGGVTQAAPKASALDTEDTRNRALDVLKKGGWKAA